MLAETPPPELEPPRLRARRTPCSLCYSRFKFILVDVREDNEWAKGHLPGAVHLGKGIIERDIEQRVPDTNAKVILYCGGGFRSALVADNLQKMGYTNVESMDGGWKGWLDAGLPIARD